MKALAHAIPLLCSVLLSHASAATRTAPATNPGPPSPGPTLRPVQGPAEVDLAGLRTVTVPRGCFFTDADGGRVGGTTFKVALIRDGDWGYSRETVLNQYQLRLPMIDVASIGAGGGSIAWVDGARLRVGPRSAAAEPGPACYGLGGTEPTVTDADLLLGYLSPERFLGGRMALHTDAAREAVRSRIAAPLFDGDVLAAAAGIRQVIDSQMADLIRKVTLERGYDPRDFVMMAYGGCGPAHAGAYGADVGSAEIVIPYFATVHSAFGAALTDVRFSLRHSEPIVLPVDQHPFRCGSPFL